MESATGRSTKNKRKERKTPRRHRYRTICAATSMSGKNSLENPPCGTLILSKTLLFVNKVNYLPLNININNTPNAKTAICNFNL